jgi:virginiamycin B lyase
MEARSTLVRRIALALLTVAVAALTLAGSADAFVYWANATDPGTIGRANLDGTPSSVNQSFISASHPLGVAVDAGHIYWTNTSATTNTIGRADLAPSGVSNINQSFIAGASIPGFIAVNATNIYWTNIGAIAIGEAPISGSPVNQGLLRVIQVIGVAADNAHLYWTHFNAIGRADVTASGVSNVNQTFITVGNGDDVEGVAAVDGTTPGSETVYWTDRTTGTIGRADIDANDQVSNINNNYIGGASGPEGVAVDANHIYWANSSASTIGRADIDASGDVSNINQSFIGGANNPFGVAVDGLTSPGPGPPPPPPPPEPTIEHLIDEVTEQGLPAGIERSLLAKLEGAQRKRDAGQTEGACGSLGAYINEVKAQNGKKLEKAYAEALILDAVAVRDALGCGSN